MSDLHHFYERHIEPIEARMIRSVWRITRNVSDAEDAMQNALLALWKRRHRIDRHPVPHALVLKICAQAACDIARRRARDRRKIEPDEHGDFVAESMLSPSDHLANRELLDATLTAINRLSRGQAVAFTLRVFDFDVNLPDKFFEPQVPGRVY
jgi:DNA-directed RNA polymerase specialized sigma24 family protein